MHLFEKGTDRWINAARYPLVQDYTEWHFGPEGELSTSVSENDGEARLDWAPPDAENGTLTFETPIFEEGATLAGPISATVYARSSNTNMALIAKLYDVAPDGRATRVSMGGLLGSQRALDSDGSWTDRNGTMIRPRPALERDEYLSPGETYRFDIPLASRQWGIAPGHHLRLEVTTQSPSDVCPEDDDSVPMATEPCRLTSPQQETLPGGEYTILHGPEHPSALNLPQLPWQVFETVRSGPPPTAWDESQRAFTDGDFTLPLDWGRGENESQ